MLFKIYADIDAFDIELAENNPDQLITTIQELSPTFGGINLEDIKAPDCFYIEERLRRLLDIPVMHDDQHGAAVTITAALLNASEIAGKEPESLKIVICGAGAAAISTARMLVDTGIMRQQITMVDSQGVINTARNKLNPQKALFAIDDAKTTTLAQAMKDCDAFIGLSTGNILTKEMLRSMADTPIIFALANPTPEIDYHTAIETRPDAIVATGRSDTLNQINNAIAFPYIFRGALDTLATDINRNMLTAAVHAISKLAHEPVPDEIKKIYACDLKFGKEYIIPKIGDSRLLYDVSSAVARAAMESGIARRHIASWPEYKEALLCRVEQVTQHTHHMIHSSNKELHKRYSKSMNEL